ncbi:MAG: hypothetical protein LBI87_15000 [Candidatus Accumulibacter sp.]|nr:hypothetical protein [Accumulibacter sp.]
MLRPGLARHAPIRKLNGRPVFPETADTAAAFSMLAAQAVEHAHALPTFDPAGLPGLQLMTL